MLFPLKSRFCFLIWYNTLALTDEASPFIFVVITVFGPISNTLLFAFCAYFVSFLAFLKNCSKMHIKYKFVLITIFNCTVP